ncbi:ABC transporter permease [bacterium]|nr:ABC transporter permease [bacterium]MCI0604317.1 ABC transporter permease [bacterium]
MWRLAFKNLIHDRIRLTITLTGISFSVVLILIQVGMFLGMTSNSSTVIEHSAGDIWIMARNSQNFDMVNPFPESLVTAARSVKGVEWAENLIQQFAYMRLENGGTEQIEIIGFDLNGKVGRPWNVIQGDVKDLRGSDAIFVDETAMERLGRMQVGENRELVRKKVRIAGTTRGIMSFTTAPYIFTSYESAQRIVPEQLAGKTTYIVVKVAPGFSVESVKKQLQQRFRNYDVHTSKDWAKKTRDYWTWQTGIGAGFFGNAFMGFIVGLVIVSQTIYSATMDHIREYGTLKAIGAKNSHVYSVILKQAGFSAVAGFVLATILQQIILIVKPLTVQIDAPPALYVGTFLLTLFMCGLAATISVRRVASIDPVEVFKG